jgi:hypothetical protein
VGIDVPHFLHPGSARRQVGRSHAFPKGTITKLERSPKSHRTRGRAMMGDTTKARQKKPGEKQPGKYNYNPGNMSGTTIDIVKDEAEQENNVDRIQSRHEHPRE